MNKRVLVLLVAPLSIAAIATPARGVASAAGVSTAQPMSVGASSSQSPMPPQRCISQPTERYIVRSNETVTVAYDTYSDSATVTLQRESPAPVAVVRQGQGRHVEFAIRPPETTVLSATSGPDCVARVSTYVSVSPVVSIAAERNAPRYYTFSGRVSPGRGQAVSLYRVDAAGHRVLTSRATVCGDGTYRIDRRFSGSGRFGFLVAVPPSATNLAGQSAERSTIIY